MADFGTGSERWTSGLAAVGFETGAEVVTSDFSQSGGRSPVSGDETFPFARLSLSLTFAKTEGGILVLEPCRCSVTSELEVEVNKTRRKRHWSLDDCQ